MKLCHAALVVVLSAVSTAASAQTLKPGLWEVTNNMKTGSGDMEKARAQMQKELANMPPEQRRQMEAMMAKQGMKMGPAGNSVRVCMTKEMVERNEIPAQQGDCRTTKNQRSGNTVHMAFTCSNPPSSGEGSYTVVSPEHYTMKMTVKSTVQGRAETMNMDGTGRWVGADCGNIKPFRPPAGK